MVFLDSEITGKSYVISDSGDIEECLPKGFRKVVKNSPEWDAIQSELLLRKFDS